MASKLLLLLFLSALSLTLQADEIADLRAALARTPAGLQRANILIDLSSLLNATAPDEATLLAEEATQLAQAAGDRTSQARAFLTLGIARYRQTDYDNSRVALEQARRIFKELGNHTEEANSVLNLGNLFLVRSAWSDAVALYEESMALRGANPPPADAAMAYANLSVCWLYQGDLLKAEEYQQKALVLRRQAGDRAAEAESLLNLGAIAYQRNDYSGAIDSYTESLRLSETLNQPRSVTAAASGLAAVFVDQRRLDDASHYTEQCIAVSRKISDRPQLAVSLVTLCIIRAKQQRYPEARQAAEEAIQLATELENPRLLGAAQANLGDTLMDEGRASEAVRNLQAAEQASEKSGDPNLLSIMRVRLAKAYRLAGQLDEALRSTEKSLENSELKANKRSIVAALDERANIREAMGDNEGALRDSRRARELDRELLDETTARKIAEAQTRYETEKKTRKIELLERDRQLQETQTRLQAERTGRQIEVLEKDRRLQRLARNSAIVGALLLLALALAALQAYLIKRRSAVALGEKIERLGEANRIITLERAKSDTLLLSILPAAIAAQLKEKAGIIAESYPHVTVLFADLVGFTLFSQTVSAEELVRLLDIIFTRFDRLANKYCVEKIKTIGDCYMVVAGLPEPSLRHCEDIARLALEMKDELHAFNLSEGLAIEIRIGFHTGPVVAGVIGRQKFIYDLWGDTVNTASRMESSGLPGRIHLTESTVRELPICFQCEPRGEIEVKGKGSLMTYFLKGVIENALLPT
ncbi:MAG: family 3 adenylate cyclase [Chthoniobacteraceae bacterium]|nr:family 3 adenylate cyclase [Chthoniobacteraceae bacterium]